jgi:hypothetical protein
VNGTPEREPNEIRHISELVDEACRELRIEPRVKLNRRGVLTFREAPGYELHIKNFATRDGLIKWFWHFLASGKRWATPAFLVDLLATIIGHDNREAGKRKRVTKRK